MKKFDFIRYSKDKEALKRLMDNDMSYRHIQEDAYDVMVQYGNANELMNIKDEYKKEGEVDMCQAIADWIAEEREAGMEAGMEAIRRAIVVNMINRGMSDEDIMALAECGQEFVDQLRNGR